MKKSKEEKRKKNVDEASEFNRFFLLVFLDERLFCSKVALTQTRRDIRRSHGRWNNILAAVKIEGEC